MNDFLDSLKEIKKELTKETKQQTIKKSKPNPNRDEFKDIFKDEEDSKNLNKFENLKDDFLKYVGYNNIKKI